MTSRIDPAARIAEGARLGEGNEIGPYAVIEEGTSIGDGNRILAGAVIKAGTRLGNRNVVHEHAVLGGDPQDLKFDPRQQTTLVVGDENVFREQVTVNRGSRPGGGTVLGNGNFLMATAHVGHDCHIGDRSVVVTSAGLGGHVHVEDRAFVSGGVMVHQFVRIGTLAMIGGNAKVTQDCLPYMITDGVPARVRGLNLVGLKRAGADAAALAELKQAYRILFRRGLRLEQILEALDALQGPHARHLAGFVRGSQRGFHRE